MKLLIAVLILATSCATSRKPQKRRAPTKAKIGEKDASFDRKRTSDYKWERFVRIHSESTRPLSEEEINEVATIEVESMVPGSLEEAAICVTILKSTAKVGFSEADINAKEEGSQQSNVSLESLANEKGIDLARALRRNVFLQHVSIHKLALRAITATRNSAEFNQSIQTAVNNTAANWAEIYSGPKEPTQGVASTSPKSFPTTRASAAEIRSNDTLLIEAQALADSKRYLDAITKVQQINKDSPLYGEAQTKVVNFSNDAVQELRQKAAQAFQSAIPVNDPKARAAYLEQAKKHLEDALNNYPNAPAEQLATVKENLAVITRDLERLEF